MTFEIIGLGDLPAEQVADLRAQEKQAGEDHIAAGRLLRMFRLPGRQAAKGIWKVDDADELHLCISQLPLFPYMRCTVEPLARHYLEEGPAFAAL